MIPAMIIKAVVPKVLKIVLKQFPGIEKINRLVDYMEKPNNADKEIEKLKSLILDKDLKMHELEMRVNNYEDKVLDIEKRLIKNETSTKNK